MTQDKKSTGKMANMQNMKLFLEYTLMAHLILIFTGCGSSTSSVPDGVTPTSGNCEPNIVLEQVSCTDVIAHSTDAQKEKKCNGDGTGFEFGDCLLAACELGYLKSGNTCITQLCSQGVVFPPVSCANEIPNSSIATKSKMCNSSGIDYDYGSCVLQSCIAGYNISGNSCVLAPLPICTPGAASPPVSCTNEIPNSSTATKSKICNSSGMGYDYGSCVLQSCIAGYNISGNSCVLAPLPEVTNLRCYSNSMMAKWDSVTGISGVSFFYVRRSSPYPLPSKCTVADEFTTNSIPQTNGGFSSPWYIRVCVYQSSTNRMSPGTTLSCNPG